MRWFQLHSLPVAPRRDPCKIGIHKLCITCCTCTAALLQWFLPSETVLRNIDRVLLEFAIGMK